MQAVRRECLDDYLAFRGLLARKGVANGFEVVAHGMEAVWQLGAGLRGDDLRVKLIALLEQLLQDPELERLLPAGAVRLLGDLAAADALPALITLVYDAANGRFTVADARGVAGALAACFGCPHKERA
jgi:hypothetical protein